MCAVTKRGQVPSTVRLILIGSALVVIVLMLARVGMQEYTMNLENRVTSLREQHRQAQLKVRSCELEIAELRKGARIKKIATEELGMKVPEGAPGKL